MKYTINMLSTANKVKGQGVGSAYDEQVALARSELSDKFLVYEGKRKFTDIMHYHTVNISYFLTIPFARANGMTVGYVHFLPETIENSLNLPTFMKKIFYRYLISFYKRMDFLVTVNPYFIDKLVYYGVDRSKIAFIPNYVCDKMFHPIENNDKSQLRSKYNLEDKFTVVCAGQLQMRKGILEYISLAAKMPHIQFVWAGGFSFGKITDGYEEISEAMKNPPSNMKFIGMIDRENMNDIYNLGDVMFLPSYEELFPMVILEAMNSNIPILLRDLEIYENILFDFYLKGSNNLEFAQILDRLSSDPAYYSLACKASERGREYYSRDHVARMWDEFYTMVSETPRIKKLHAKRKYKELFE